MDPKNLSQLDPKLREAYERVMGTNANQPTPQPVNIPSVAPEPTAPPVTNSELPPLPPFPSTPEQPVQNQPQPQSENLPPIQNTQSIPSAIPQHESIPPIPTAENPVAKTPNAAAASYSDKSKGKFTPVLIALGLVVFFVVWAILWIKILGL